MRVLKFRHIHPRFARPYPGLAYNKVTVTTKPIPIRPSGVHLQGTKYHFHKRGVLLQLASSHFGGLEGWRKRRHGECGTAMLGETTDEAINQSRSQSSPRIAVSLYTLVLMLLCDKSICTMIMRGFIYRGEKRVDNRNKKLPLAFQT